MEKQIRLALCQNEVVADKEKNLQRAKEMIDQAAKEQVDFIILPEMFNCPYENSHFPNFAESLPAGKTYHMLSNQAQKHGVYLIGGSIPERVKNKQRSKERLYNTSLIFGPDGKLLGKHRKIHLFDVDLSEGVTFLESDTLDYGQEITVIDTNFLKVGIAICYDLRFPELMRLMVNEGAEMIVLPGAFNTVTGPAHWKTLLKTRAIDNQVFMVGASPARNEEAEYQAYGHSLVANPWGEILAEAGSEEEVIICNIDLGRLEEIRKELPLLKHRRTDLYRLEKTDD